MKFRKKPVVIEATQWWRNGDHPEDDSESIPQSDPWKLQSDSLTEGKVVRYFRRPGVDIRLLCGECGFLFRDHGWIDIPEGGHCVCPGDWIITGVAGERYPCKPAIFQITYERVE